MNTLRPAQLEVDRAKASSLVATGAVTNQVSHPVQRLRRMDARRSSAENRTPQQTLNPGQRHPSPTRFQRSVPIAPKCSRGLHTARPRGGLRTPCGGVAAAARSASSARTQRVRSPRCTGRECTGRAAHALQRRDRSHPRELSGCAAPAVLGGKYRAGCARPAR